MAAEVPDGGSNNPDVPPHTRPRLRPRPVKRSVLAGEDDETHLGVYGEHKQPDNNTCAPQEAATGKD